MKADSCIFVAGHSGMVGHALMRALEEEGYRNVIRASREALDLRDSRAVAAFFDCHRPEYVFLLAARVGGIHANRQFPARFLYDNLMIQCNVIHEAHRFGARKVLFLGSSCMYPRDCPQPMREDYLLTGPLEPTNEAYALAKIAGVKMAQYYYQEYQWIVVCPVPCNLYGPHDNFDLRDSHVLSALVRRFVDARDEDKHEITLWGTGTARREFLHVSDLARAVIFLMNEWHSPEIINVGSGTDVSIKELAEMIASQVVYEGAILWDTTMPDGMLRKCLDVSRLAALGFAPTVALQEGIRGVVDEYRDMKALGMKMGPLQ